MSQTVGDFLVGRLHAWDVRRVFGYPGDGINGVFGALNRAKGKAALKGDPSERRMIAGAVRQLADALLPGHER